MAKKKTQLDTLVIGAGVVGLSLAWELAKRGQQVCIVDSGQSGRAASWAGAGILPPAANRNAIDPYEQLRSLSHGLHPGWALDLKKATGIDTGFQRCGGIYVARSPGETATLIANGLWWDEHGIEHTRLTARDLIEIEPNLIGLSSEERSSSWLLPDECQLRNPRHLKALLSACRQIGVTVREQTELRDFVRNSDSILQAHMVDGDAISANNYCICSGAWARLTLEELGISNGIMPVRGQIVLYRCPQRPLRHVINEGHRYLVPRDDGLVLAGSIEEEVGYDCTTTQTAIGQISDWAIGLLPLLKASEVVKSWAGLRPGSYDGLPYLGRVPETTNLFVAAGHFRSGLYLSCGTAVVMANLIEGKQNSIDLRPFRVARG